MAQRSKRTTDLLSGPVAKTLIVYAAPLFVTNFCQIMLSVVDMAIIGQVVGSNALAGVTIGTDLMHFLMFFGFGLTMAGQVIISRKLGAGEMDKAKDFIETFFTFLCLCSIVIMVLSMAGSRPALEMMNTPAEAMEDAWIYLFVCLAGMPALLLFNTAGSIYRACGDSKRPMYFVTAGALINLGLDILFIVYWGMGAFGAALATVIGQCISTIVAYIYLFRFPDTYHLKLSRSMFHLEKGPILGLVKLGIPMALQSASISFSRVFMMSFINGYGVAVSATTGVITRIASIARLYDMAISTATSVMVAYAYGARAHGRIREILKWAFTITLTCSSLFALLVYFNPGLVFGVFTTDAAVMALCMEYLPLLIIDLFAGALRAPSIGMINGSGKSALNLSVAVFDGPVFRMAFAAFLGLAMNMGYYGFWVGNTVAGFTPPLVALAYWGTKAVLRRITGREISLSGRP